MTVSFSFAQGALDRETDEVLLITTCSSAVATLSSSPASASETLLHPPHTKPTPTTEPTPQRRILSCRAGSQRPITLLQRKLNQFLHHCKAHSNILISYTPYVRPQTLSAAFYLSLSSNRPPTVPHICSALVSERADLIRFRIQTFPQVNTCFESGFKM